MKLPQLPHRENDDKQHELTGRLPPFKPLPRETLVGRNTVPTKPCQTPSVPRPSRVGRTTITRQRHQAPYYVNGRRSLSALWSNDAMHGYPVSVVRQRYRPRRKPSGTVRLEPHRNVRPIDNRRCTDWRTSPLEGLSAPFGYGHGSSRCFSRATRNPFGNGFGNPNAAPSGTEDSKQRQVIRTRGRFGTTGWCFWRVLPTARYSIAVMAPTPMTERRMSHTPNRPVGPVRSRGRRHMPSKLGWLSWHSSRYVGYIKLSTTGVEN